MNNIEKDKNRTFRFKHNLGQNFLKDKNLLNAIVSDAGIVNGDYVLEIGAGAGALTEVLCQSVGTGRVVAVEIDKTLSCFLSPLMTKFHNFKLVFDDILKVPFDSITDWFDNKSFKVVANLPYYITTPIIFYLLESSLDIESITIMVQQEVADRIIASPNTKDYGAITPILKLYGTAKITRKVNKNLFTPVPKVDSAVVHLDINRREGINIAGVSKFIRNCFSMRRKTLSNNLLQTYQLSREVVEQCCKKANISPGVRAECLSVDDFINLYNCMTLYINH